jgi:hypothetical protein
MQVSVSTFAITAAAIAIAAAAITAAAIAIPTATIAITAAANAIAAITISTATRFAAAPHQRVCAAADGADQRAPRARERPRVWPRA